MNRTISIRLIIIALIGCALAMIIVLLQNKKEQSNPPSNISKPEPFACPQDVKKCPDGSFVSHRGPNCEFAPCPKNSFVKENQDRELVGNDRDEHGCIGSAGYIWCESKQKCLRTFEETCEDPVLREDWQIYRNEKLGFEISLPKLVNLWTDAGKNKSHPVKTLESGNIVWFYPEGDFAYSERAKKITSKQTEFEKVQGIPWAILLKKISNDAELENFIQERYGKECKLGAKTISNQAGVFDVSIKESESGEPGEGCFLNWALVIKYDPTRGQVAAWDLGQDITFAKISFKGELLHSFDEEMVKSFKFVN